MLRAYATAALGGGVHLQSVVPVNLTRASVTPTLPQYAFAKFTQAPTYQPPRKEG